jgi:hypothetical protein
MLFKIPFLKKDIIYTGNDNLPKYSRKFPDSTILDFIASIDWSENQLAIALAIPFLSQIAIKYPCSS